MLAIAGILFKVVEKVLTLRGTHDAKGITLLSYLSENFLRTFLGTLGTFAVFLICYRTGQLNEVAAFACGYLGESAARAITQKFKV